MAGLITTTYDSGEIPIISLTRTLKFNPKILHYGAVTDMAKGEGTFDDGSVHAVAVKSLRCVGGTQVNNSSLFDEHIKLLMAHLPRWTELRHKNINPVLDLEISSRPLLINPWIQYNLREIIYSKTEHGERWNLKQRLDKWSVIEDVCAGMEYLHTRTPRPVTHGALGMKAVLIEDNNGVLCAKLSNFGLEPILCRLSLDATLTRAHDPAEYTSAPETVTGTLPDYDEATGAGPPGMDDDPDIVAPGGLTPASDIYDAGTWMLELLSEKVPWGGLGRGTTYMRTIAGIRPTPAEHPGLPEDHQAWQLIRRCWAQEPRDRPSIRKVCEDVDEIRLFYAQIPSQKSRL